MPNTIRTPSEALAATIGDVTTCARCDNAGPASRTIPGWCRSCGAGAAIATWRVQQGLADGPAAELAAAAQRASAPPPAPRAPQPRKPRVRKPPPAGRPQAAVTPPTVPSREAERAALADMIRAEPGLPARRALRRQYLWLCYTMYRARGAA